jgi:protein TonB
MKPSFRKILFTAILAAAPLLLRAADIEPPVPVRTVAPVYPVELRDSGTSGMVVVSCEIDEKGTVVSAKVSKSTNDAFNKPALEAVEKWKFRPAQKDGKAVQVSVTLPVKFSNEL